MPRARCFHVAPEPGIARALRNFPARHFHAQSEIFRQGLQAPNDAFDIRSDPPLRQADENARGTFPGGLAKQPINRGTASGIKRPRSPKQPRASAFAGRAGPAPPAFGREGVVGTSATVAPQVQILDAKGQGIPGLRVRWQVGANSGVVTSDSSLTDPSGIALSGGWNFGTVAGTQTLAALGIWSGFTDSAGEAPIQLNWFPATLQAEPTRPY